MSNKLKSEGSEGVKEKKQRKSKVTFRDKLRSVRSVLADERTHKLIGLVMLLTSFFLFVAFVSNLFTWKNDQAIAGADSLWSLLQRTDLEVDNWLGKFGTIVSLRFENEWFGISAFVFPFIIGLAGIRIVWDNWLLPIGKTLRYSFFTVVWLSTFLGYIFHNTSSFLIFAGGYGYRMSQTLNSLTGFIGTGTILVFSFVGFLVAAFNMPLRRMRPELIKPVKLFSV